MKSAIVLALIGATYTSAQVEYNNGSFVCAVSDANYCAGDSLSTNIIIRCTGTEGQPGNCNDNLAGIPPVGVKSSATCYQSSPSAGDAACSFDGNVYPEDDGSGPFPVPSGRDDHSSAADTSSYGGSMTTVITRYTTGTVTNTYTVTVPCPTTTTAAPSPPTGSPTPTPSATTVSTAVTESSCYSDCPGSSAAPPTVAPPPSSPVETHPTPAPAASSEVPSPSPAPSAPYTPSEAPPALPASSEAPPTPAPPASPSAPATPSEPSPPAPPVLTYPAATPSTLTSITVVPGTPAPPPGTTAAPVGTPSASTSTPPVSQYTGAAVRNANAHGNSFAGIVGLAVVAVAVV